MIRILGTLLAGLLGLAFGSFLNVCLSRWPEGESIIHPRSHCRSCDRTLAWWENIPVLSWLALRARCRTCKARISWRYPLVELAVSALWAIEMWRSLPSEPAAIQEGGVLLYEILCAFSVMVFLWMLLAMAILDAEHLWLPDGLTLPGTAVGFISSVFLSGFVNAIPAIGHSASFRIGAVRGAIISARGAVIAAALILLIRSAYWLIRRREGIGLGDAKLMAMLGAWLGLSGALLSFALGVALGAVFALILLAIPASHRGSDAWLAAKLPLGTFLCIGGIISALWGQPIINAYLHYAGF